MSKRKIVPAEPTPEMRSEFERWYSENGQHMDAVERLGDGYHLGRTQFAWMAWKEAWIAAAPAPVASAEDIERVAEALWLAQTLRLLRDDPDTARLSYDELCQSVQDELRWDARAALRAMGYEVEG